MKRVLALLSAAALCFTVLAGCRGNETETAVQQFTQAVEEIGLPIGKDSADPINDAYDLYFGLTEEQQRAVREGKQTLDGYAAVCNAILAVVYRAGEIGEYGQYTVYARKIGEAKAAYDKLISLSGGHASDADVRAAKALIDSAQAVYDAKTALIGGYVDAVNAVEEYDGSEISYSEWAAKLDAAGQLYSALSAPQDDLYSLSEVSEARKLLKAHNVKREELLAKIGRFEADVAAAEEKYDSVFGTERPFYEEEINGVFDQAEASYLAAKAARLTEDPVTAQVMETWQRLTGEYYGIRYSTEFESDMNGVEAMLTLPSLADELEQKLLSAGEHYEKIPQADRGGVSTAKALFDRAQELLPALKEEKSFIESVNAIDFTNETSLAALREKEAAAASLWHSLEEHFGYTQGTEEVDAAKATLAQKQAEIAAVGAFVDAVSALPTDEVPNTKEIYEKLQAAASLYEALDGKQREYPLVVNANVTYTRIDARFEAQKTDMFSGSAYYKDGTEVESGFAMLSVDEAGKLQGDGARKNYLQALYTVAAHKPEHKVNGVVVDESHSDNVDAEAVKTYMKENFEYVFTLYGSAETAVGEVCKDMVYDEAAQVPSDEELQAFFPVYYNESDTVEFRYGIAIRVKADATDGDLGYLIRAAAETKGETAAKTTGDPKTRQMLSPANLLGTESNTNLHLMRNNSNVCAYSESLNYQYVGAVDVCFYLGNEVKEDALLEWIRIVKETEKVGSYPHKANAYVRTFRGSSLEEKKLSDEMKTDKEYIAADVEDITATVLATAGTAQNKQHGWLLSNTVGYGNAWAKIADIANLFSTLGHSGLSGKTITVVARLRVNAAGAAAGIQDSPFCTPIQIVF